MIEVSKDKLNSIKLTILGNKKLNITIDKNQYTISYINDFVNKIDSKRISRNDAINIYNDIAEKGKKNCRIKINIKQAKIFRYY